MVQYFDEVRFVLIPKPLLESVERGRQPSPALVYHSLDVARESWMIVFVNFGRDACVQKRGVSAPVFVVGRTTCTRRTGAKRLYGINLSHSVRSYDGHGVVKEPVRLSVSAGTDVWTARPISLSAVPFCVRDEETCLSTKMGTFTCSAL